jgi:MFS family permease
VTELPFRRVIVRGRRPWPDGVSLGSPTRPLSFGLSDPTALPRTLQDVRWVERFGPLKERSFRLLWFARTGSSVGDSLIPVALIWGVHHHLHSSTGVGLVLASYFGGSASVTLAGGVLADRLPRRAVMIAADLLRVGTQSATAILFFQGTARVWEIALLQAVAGAAAGSFNPASLALIPRTVSAGRLQEANALIAMSRSAASVLGPGVSGVIVAVAGPGWVFAIDAASFLVSAAFVAMMRVETRVRPVAQRFWSDLADGWREVRRHRWLMAGFLGLAVVNFGVGVYVVRGSLVAMDDLGGPWAWGLVGGSAAVGGVLGGLVVYRIRPSHPVAAAVGIWSLSALLPFTLLQPFPLPAVMAAGLLFGGALLVGNTLWETAMQQEVEPNRLARVASIDVLLSLCLMPVGQALSGPLSNAIGVHATLVLAGLLMFVPNLAVVVFVRDVRAARGASTPLRPRAPARAE